MILALGLGTLLAPARLKTVLLLPVQTVVHAPNRLLAELSANLSSRARENERLARLAAELAVENARLRALTQVDSRAPGDTLLLMRATVIGRDLATFERYLTISLGRHSGVGPGAPVITADGVVGIVTACGDHQSIVQTLISPSARVAVMNLRSRTPGVARPDRNRLLDVSYLPRDADYQAGDTVVTAGLGRVFPKGLMVGIVVPTPAGNSSTQAELFKPVKVKPFVDFSRLDAVFVLRLPDAAPIASRSDGRSRVWLENLAPDEVSPPEEEQ
ncbi:MAG: rod shape-determining protein MreC [candidate division WOR-3 bacterium]